MALKKFSIILADPPWTFKVWSERGGSRSASSHYPILDEIKKIPVSRIAADDSVLFLWITSPMLPMGLEVIKAWGFEFKTVAFTWIKLNKKSGGLFFGLGYWTRANPEFCLLATRGSPKRMDKAVHSVVMTPIQDHSQKPVEVKERIVRLLGDLPRIELFARETTPGWVAVGNEIDGRDVREVFETMQFEPKPPKVKQKKLL